MRRGLGILALTAIVSVWPASALGQSAQDKVAAEALFDEGRKLLAAGKFGEACPKFADSQRLDPAPGTLLNLADCYEKNGQTATAWVHFREATSAARAAGDSRREAAAKGRAAALEATLSRLTVTVAARADIAGLEITLDGQAYARALWGAPTPVDPGSHTLEAKAPGRKPWSTKVAVGAKGAMATVTIPTLADASNPGPGPVAPPVPPGGPDAGQPATKPDPAPPPVAPDTGASGSSQRVLALVVGGVGVVGVGVGTVFGLVASSKSSESDEHCREGNFCSREGVELRDSALSAATVSTIAFGVGAAGLVGGAVLWFTAPRRPQASRRVQVLPAVGASSNGAVVRGSF